MLGNPHRQLFRVPVGRSRLALAGWLLYAASWVTPSIDGRQLGAVAFVDTLRITARLLASATPSAVLQGACLMLGWLANISIFFFQLRPRARALWIAAPWLAFGVVLLTVPVRPSIPQRAAYFLYFYPWAIGIAAIHLAGIAAARTQAVTDAAR